MIWNIARKEFLANLLNQRFVISLVLLALISWTSTFILTKNYNDELNDYHRRVNLQNRMIDDYFHLQAWDGGLMMPATPPPVLSSLVQGVQRGIGVFGSIDENPVVVLFPFMDILFVVGVLMSIAALTLSYDRISGEKEAGTLRLLLASSCSRGRILLGKWMGGILSVLVLLMISLLGSVLVALTLSESSWSATEWIDIAALIVLSGLYCSVFYSLGLMISARTQTPSDSIILALMFFVLFALILPTVPPYIADIVYPVPSPAKAQYQAFVVMRQEDEAAYKKLREQYAAQGFKEDQINELIKPEWEKIHQEFLNKADELKTSVVRGSVVREGIAALFHALSPFSSYVLAGAEITATGALHQVYSLESADQYVARLYREYLPKKEAEARKANPNFTKTTKLDISDRPRFQYHEEPMVYRLAASGAHTVFLLIYLIVFLVLAWKAFRRFDVR